MKNFSSYKRLYLCLLLSSGLFSCTSLEEQTRIAECKARNSHNDGYSDATNGFKSRFQIYNKRCEPYGVSLNKNLYVKGYKKGIKAFCTHKGGYQLGLKAGKYKNTCPINKEEFLKGYNEGDEKCLYKAGYNDAVEGRKNSYEKSSCLKTFTSTQSKALCKRPNRRI